MLLLTLILVSVTNLVFGTPHADQVDLIREFEANRTARIYSLDADSAHSYDQTALYLDFRVENDVNSPLAGNAIITITALEPISWIPFNAEGLSILNVSEDETTLEYLHANDTLWVNRPMTPGQSATFNIQMTAPVQSSFFDVGYHVDWERVFTFAEPFGARAWYPCWDQPYDKFDDVTVAVNMPDHWSLASNGLLISTTFPEPGRKKEIYHSTDPISSYLVMIAAGLYAKRVEEVDGIQYRYFAYPQDSADAAIDWSQTPQMASCYAGLIGSYPFDAYGMVEAAIFNGWGAMEHQTFTTYGHRLIDGQNSYDVIVAHELVHQWFGDYISPVDFRNIWLNEGFATYFAAVWFEQSEGEESFQQNLRAMSDSYFQEDATGLRYAAYDPPEDYIFGSVVYNKAGWVLHMLREQLLGDELFYQVMREWVSRYANGTVNTEDFINLVNEMSGEDYRWFFDQWIYQAGHPELIISTMVITTPHGEFGDLQVVVRQVQDDAPLFRFPLTVELSNENGTTQQTLWFDAVDTWQVQYATYWHISGGRLADSQPLLYVNAPDAVGPDPTEIPDDISLQPCFPNPFNSAISIPFEISTRSRVEVAVYNLNGQLIKQIIDAVFNAGKHTIAFTADANLSSGMYFVKLESGKSILSQKIVILK
jgi:aminopeptidase N